MSLVSCGTQRCALLVQRNLYICQKRFSVRESVHRHTEPDKFKKHMLAACEPYIKKVYTLDHETCKGPAKKLLAIHPLEVILAKELLEDINNSEFTLFLQHNYTRFQDERVYKNQITKSGAKFHAQNNNIYRETFKNSNLTDISTLFIGRNSLITGKTEVLPNVIRLLRKMPSFLLLCGFVDRHLYNIDQIKLIAEQPNIDLCRANLLSTLNRPAITIHSYLQEHGKTLNCGDAPTTEEVETK